MTAPLVLDTSVIVKVFVEEEGSARATALFAAAVAGTYRLAAPELMAFEFGNVLWKYVQRAVMSAAEAREALDRLPYDRIDWLPARAVLPDALRLATAHRIPVYDAAFLAAAAILAADLVTGDRAFHRSVAPACPWVKLLDQYEP